MAKHTVDEFVIELGFSEKVMRGLNKVEKQVLPVAKRIEDKLNKAFQVDGSKHMSKTFARIAKDAERTAAKIKKSLQSAFDIKGAGKASMRGFENDAAAMARRIAKELQKAYNVKPPKLPPLPPRGGAGSGGGRGGAGGAGGGPRGGSGGGRGNTGNWIESHYIRNSENGMTNAMAALGMIQQRNAFRAELRSLADRHRTDATTHAYERAARQLIFSYKQQIAEQRRLIAAQERSRFMQRSLQESTMHLARGFVSAYTALEYFTNALEEGAKRAQAKTMLSVAYDTKEAGQAMGMRADKIANDYGLDVLTTRQQMAQMRMTMPSSFSNDKIAELLENESVFAHMTGMTKDAVGRLNYAMQQIAASTRLMGQDWLQVVNASPALVKKMIEQFQAKGYSNVKDVRTLKEEATKMSGAQFVEEMMEAMRTSDAVKQMAKDNIMASRGRLENAVKSSQDYFFRGFEGGLRHLMDALSSLLNNSSGAFEGLGDVLGFIFEKLEPIVYNLQTVMMNLSGWIMKLEYTTAQLRKDSGAWDILFKTISAIGGAVVGLTAFATVVKLIGSFAGVFVSMAKFMKLGGVGAAAGAGAEGAAGAAAAGGLTGFVAGIVPVVVSAVAAYLVTKPFADLIFGDLTKRFQKAMGWNPEETTHGGNAVKGSWVDKGWNMFDRFKAYYDNTPDITQPIPGLGYMKPDQKTYASFSFSPIQFEPILLKIPMPDGSIYQQAVDLINTKSATMILTSQGTSNSWTPAGENAGFSPSSLMRK